MQSAHNNLDYECEIKKDNFIYRSLWLVPVAIFSMFLFSLWDFSQFYKNFQFNNAMAGILINQMILPTLALLMLMKIFSKYVSRLWSISLAFVGLISFTNYPFRDFILNIILNHKLTGSSELPAIFGATALGCVLFLTLFYFSINYFKFPSRRFYVLTMLWALVAKFSIFDSILGLAFWFPYFIIKLIRQKHLRTKANIAEEILLQCFIVGVIYYLIPFTEVFPSGNVGNQIELPPLYYLLYFILPLALTIGTYFVQRVDKYELFVKFWHVFTLMFAEIALTFISGFYNFSEMFNPMSGYSSLFFLHFYYYIPALYYLTKPYKDFSSGVESTMIMQNARKLLSKIFNQYSVLYLSLIIVTLIVFAITSSLNYNKI